MSKIIAYTGDLPATEILLDGLLALDGGRAELCGIALKDENAIDSLKKRGGAQNLSDSVKIYSGKGVTGIAECAEAERGKPSAVNTVPASNDKYAVVCSGYIENFDALKERATGAYRIETQEDLLLAIINIVSAENELEKMKKLTPALKGNPTYAFISSENEAIFCRAGELPLAVGIAQGGIYVSSELTAMPIDIKRYFYIESGEYARITAERATVYDERLRRIKKNYSVLTHPVNPESMPYGTSELGCVFAVRETLSKLICGETLSVDFAKLAKKCTDRVKRIIFTGSGDMLCAARLAAYNTEMAGEVTSAAIPSGELRHSGTLFDRSLLAVIISETGEGENEIACAKRAKLFGAKTLAVTFNENSYLSNICDEKLVLFSANSSAGAFASVSLALSLFAVYLSYKNDVINDVQLKVTLKLAEMLTGKVSSAMKLTASAAAAAELLAKAKRVFVTGLGADYSLSEQAARGFRSANSVNAYAYPSCELVLENRELLNDSAVLYFVTNRELAQKSLRFARRLKALGARVIIVTSTDIEADINDFENVIAFSDSIALFNSLTAFACSYRLSTAVCELESESKTPAAV